MPEAEKNRGDNGTPSKISTEYTHPTYERPIE